MKKQKTNNNNNTEQRNKLTKLTTILSLFYIVPLLLITTNQPSNQPINQLTKSSIASEKYEQNKQKWELFNIYDVISF